MKQYIPYIIIGVLLVFLFLSLNREDNEVIIEKKTTDTVTIVRIDTLIERIPTFISDTIVDTIVIEKTPDSVLKLPITQKFYEGDKYKAWVSGFNPRLDSINVFNNVITNNVVTTDIKEIYPQTTDIFINIGVIMIDDQFTPHIGAMVKFKNNITLGGQLGYYDKKSYYGINVGLKLNR